MKFCHDFFEPVQLERIDLPTGRIYKKPDGRQYNSVTSVLSAMSDKTSLDKWRARVGESKARVISRTATQKGEMLHKICEGYLLNKPDFARGAYPFTKDSFAQIRPFIDSNIGSVCGIEHFLYSDKLKAAGTADLIAQYEGTMSIVDFKTSARQKKPEWIRNYFMQATAYAIMVEELYNVKVPQLVILMAVEDGYPDIFRYQTEAFRADTISLFEAYQKKRIK